LWNSYPGEFHQIRRIIFLHADQQQQQNLAQINNLESIKTFSQAHFSPFLFKINGDSNGSRQAFWRSSTSMPQFVNISVKIFGFKNHNQNKTKQNK
jgi:hypothetical protein